MLVKEVGQAWQAIWQGDDSESSCKQVWLHSRAHNCMYLLPRVYVQRGCVVVDVVITKIWLDNKINVGVARGILLK